jgi:cytochrome c oxidase cbb3-type subunit II
MERLSTIVFAAGLGCFVFAGVLSGWLPVAHLSKIKYQTMDQIAPRPSLEFQDLAVRYPVQFKKYFGKPSKASFHRALKLGKKQYIAEGCWHCHSQYVRPVANESVRFGPVSWAGEYMNEMNLPHLFGTRRVGPDLIREHGKHSNDWHVAHLFEPTDVVRASVMPSYKWFFDGEKPNDKGLAVVTYVQWLGSWATPEALARKSAKQ